MTDSDNDDKKETRSPFSPCSWCKARVKWEMNPETGKWRPLVPGTLKPHICIIPKVRRNNYGYL